MWVPLLHNDESVLAANVRARLRPERQIRQGTHTQIWTPRCVTIAGCGQRAGSALPASAGDRKGSACGLCGRGCPGLGMAESAPCPLIAAGFCERAGGSRGAQRPRSGAAGAFDAIARERIMPGGGGRGALVCGISGQRFWLVAFLRGVISRGGRGTRPGAASLTLARGAWAAPVT